MMIRPRFPRTSLSILAVLLAASGALRIGFGVGQALARAPETAAQTEEEQCAAPPLAVAEALSEREALLTDREAALEERLAALDLSEAAIKTRLQELEAAESRLKELVAVSQGAAEQDLTRLTAVYEAMRPEQAAAVFSAMPPEFAAGFLGRMRPEAAAQVLAGMEPERAFTISATIAGRNADAPTE